MDYSIIKSLEEEAKRLAGRRKPLPGNLPALKKQLQAFEKKYQECLGAMPAEKYPLKPRLEQKVLFDDTKVVQERVVYHTEEFAQVPAHVYYHKDKKGKLPGVLYIQGWEDQSKYTLPFFKTRLAQEGYLVLFPDNRCSGERKREFCQTEQLNVIPAAGVLGKTFMGMNTYDNIRALDYLLSRPDVDKERISVVGLCWGGMQAYNLAARDKRVGCAVCVNSNSTYKALLTEFIYYSAHTCLGTYIPNLMKYGDTVDIYALIAPRPLLLMNNANDYWFPLNGYLQICTELERAYKAFGASARFGHLLSSNLHDIVGIYANKTVAWLNRHNQKVNI